MSGTGNSSWDGTYTRSGFHNGKYYWVNDSNTFYIYFDLTTNQWCLSESLDGNCLLSGKSPCYSVCPDLCEDYLIEGNCPTPTPTPEPPCDVDFTALFDCEYEPTPTPTPTPTLTPTPTPTPTPTSVCNNVAVDATINSTTPTPTPTTTPTPTPTPTVDRPCNFLGNVTYNTVNDLIKCPSSKQFQDCFNGDMYYTTSVIENPTPGEDIERFMVFEAIVDGISKCVSYVGVNNDTIGINQVSLVDGPFGYSNLGDCVYCTPSTTTTTTTSATTTTTSTSSTTTTTTSNIQTYYVYVSCSDPNTVLVQTLPALTTTTGSVIYEPTSKECWQFDYQSSGYPQLSPQLNVINYTGNYLINADSQIYIDCESCLSTICQVDSQYIGYDQQCLCYINRPRLLSVDFHIIPSQVLVGSPLSPCDPYSFGGNYDCPQATIVYSINGGPSTTIYGDIGDVNPISGTYNLSCELKTAHIESYIDVTSYVGQLITVDYTVSYPPSLSFTQTVTQLVPIC